MSDNEDHLFKLIKSLSSSEKRYFSLYASRHTMGEKNNSVKMFQKLEALEHYDEKKFREKNSKEAFVKHYRFNKHFLYRLILQALRSFHAGKTAEAEIREHIHYIDILVEKGLFGQALEMIDSTKVKAMRYQFFELYFELLHKELSLHRDHGFADADEEKIASLFTEMETSLQDMHALLELEKVSVRISQRLAKGGFPRNKKNLDDIFGINVTAKLKKAPTQFSAAWNFYTSKLAISFMKRDYEKALDGVNALIELVESRPHLIAERPKPYINVLHNKIVLLNNLHKYDEVPAVAEKIKIIPVRSQVLRNRKFYASHNLLLSMYPMTGEFEKGVALLKVMEEQLASGEVQITIPGQRLTHTFACCVMQFCAGNYAAANKYMQELMSLSDLSPRADILAFARIFSMMIQFEMGKQDLLEYTVRSVYRFLYRRKRIYKFEDCMLRFIRKKVPVIDSAKEMIAAFKELHDELLPLTEDPYERNAFAYFDMISWLQSKIQNRAFADVVKEKIKALTR